jgi:F-box protein 21
MPMEWVVQMGVDQLNGGHLQPFYNVLVEDHTTRYVAQENILIPKDPHPILHFSAGKYFAAYKGDHYQPNRVLRRAYPEDQYCAGQP